MLYHFYKVGIINYSPFLSNTFFSFYWCRRKGPKNWTAFLRWVTRYVERTDPTHHSVHSIFDYSRSEGNGVVGWKWKWEGEKMLSSRGICFVLWHPFAWLKVLRLLASWGNISSSSALSDGKSEKKDCPCIVLPPLSFIIHLPLEICSEK